MPSCENGSGWRASTSASRSSGCRPAVGSYSLIIALSRVRRCGAGRAGRRWIVGGARVAEQPARERGKTAHRQAEPCRTIGGLITDFVGVLFDQEQVEQSPLRNRCDERLGRLCARVAVRREETLGSIAAEAVEQRALAIGGLLRRAFRGGLRGCAGIRVRAQQTRDVAHRARLLATFFERTRRL